MRTRILSLGVLIAGLAFSQQGHPLTGTWSGDWGPSAKERHQVTLVMNWDGKNVTGLINPGPDSIPIASVTVDVTKWIVRITAGMISAEGHVDDLGAYHRTLSGTWQQGNVKGDFKLTRD